MSCTKINNPQVGRQFARFAIPAVIGMVVSSLYNIVDGIFVGRGIGADALGAINIVYPFIMLQIAVSMMISIGGANAFSACRGKGDEENANNFFLQSMYLIIALSVVLNTIVLIFTPQVCRLLGADEVLLPHAEKYIWWIALFNLLYMPGMGLSIFIRNDDAPNRELAGTLAGTVVNIILDYLFIMVYGMDIAGAAIATGIGQMVSLMIFLSHFLKKKRILRFGKAAWRKEDLRRILFGGIPTFLMEFSQSAVAFSFNGVLMSRVGAVGVSYYGIVMYICSMFNMVLIGLTQGAQPVMSFHYGGGDMDLVRGVRRIAIRTALFSTAAIYTVIFFAGGGLAAVFVADNPALTDMAADMMRYYFLAFFPIGMSLMNILYFQVTEQNAVAIVISFLRCLGFIQLFLLLLPDILGIHGIYLSFLCGELCHCGVSAALMKKSEAKQKKAALVKQTAAAEKA